MQEFFLILFLFFFRILQIEMLVKFRCLVYLEKSTNKYKKLKNILRWESSVIAFSFPCFFFIFNCMFLLFVLPSIVVNHKAATAADVINKIIGVLKYIPEKIGACDHEKTNHKINGAS